MDISERLNRALAWCLTCLLVVPLCTVLMRVLNRTLIFSPRVFREYDVIPYHVPEERNFFKGRLMSWFMRRMECIPVRRGEGAICARCRTPGRPGRRSPTG